MLVELTACVFLTQGETQLLKRILGAPKDFSIQYMLVERIVVQTLLLCFVELEFAKVMKPVLTCIG
jgi:hypothetical protein